MILASNNNNNLFNYSWYDICKDFTNELNVVFLCRCNNDETAP